MSVREEQKYEVQQATDIVRLIGEQISLKGKGKDYVGLCPFHDDSRPSMYVSPAKQIYKCFSCGAGGDVFSFAMNYHKMTFPDALSHLADRAGIRLRRDFQHGDDRSGGESSGVSLREQVGEANRVACGFFRSMLVHEQTGVDARRYLQSRGISDAMIESFQIGYAPNRWDALAEVIHSKRLAYEGFGKAGLVAARKDGSGFYDRFRGRVVFPILDPLGRPVAFGARQLDADDEPKYLNSPESVVFKKSATLYGLHVAQRPIIDAKTAIVVEGYTDVVACHQAGVCNVVATLGTALTAQHVQVLSRLCEKVILLFDADAAGQKAADRALEVFLSGTLDVAVAVLPPGVDPADMLARKGGIDEFDQIVAGSADALEYKLSRLRSQLGEAGTMAARQRVSQQYITDLAALGLGGQGVIRDAMLIQRVGELLRLNERQVRDLLAEAGRQARARAGSYRPKEVEDLSGPGVVNEVQGHRITAQRAAEQQVIGCLVRKPDLFHATLSDGRSFDEAMTPAEISDPIGRNVYQDIYQQLSEGGSVTLAGLLAGFAGQDDGRMAVYLTEAEAVAERCTEGSNERLIDLWRGAMDTLQKTKWQNEFDRQRDAIVGTEGGGNIDQLMHQVAEYRRGNPSPARILRPQQTDI